MVKRVVPAEECGVCDCWVCFCEGHFPDATDQEPVYSCVEDCQSSMRTVLFSLLAFAILFLLLAASRRWYPTAWAGVMVVTLAVISIVMANDVPANGEEDLVFSCQFPVDVVAYGIIAAFIGAVAACIISSVSSARHKKRGEAEVSVELSNTNKSDRRNSGGGLLNISAWNARKKAAVGVLAKDRRVETREVEMGGAYTEEVEIVDA